MTDQPTAASVDSPQPRAWFALAVLLVLFVMSYIDRSGLNLFVDPIKADLGITDTGFSLLTGAAFALFYATMAIPLAMYSDRRGRKWVIIGGVLLWGLATGVSGLATGFGLLLLLRLGVGFGEAALTPNAWAMIPELFPPRLRGRAIALFVSGGVLGSGLALMAPAAIGDIAGRVFLLLWPSMEALAPWRAALLGLGVLTLVAAIPAFWLPVGKRATSSTVRLRDSFTVMWARRRDVALLFATGAVANAVITGTMTWLPAYFMRQRAFTVEQAGAQLGLTFVLAGFVGTLASGWLADRAGASGSAARSLRLVAITTLMAVPFLGAAMFAPTAGVALGCVGVSLSLSCCMSTLLPLAVQAKSRDGDRAQTAAWFLLVANLAGFGLGPTLPALVSDYGFGGAAGIGWAILAVSVVGSAVAAACAFREREPTVVIR